MERNIVEDLHEQQLMALEQRLCAALLENDRDALTALVSPALFMMDGHGGRMLDL
ncbi:MAG TPA: nuclear transport factor 2 family protein, partial [Stenotrophomonas sp.]|nr:nuclear transport factor 2 family protein [Stenotrophomonas sp.]